RTLLTARCRIALRYVGMCRNLACGQSHGFRPAGLALRESRSHVNRDPALQVGQGESVLSVAAVSGADEVEECLILADGNQGSVAKRPSYWGKVSGKHPYLADKWS